MRLSSFAGTDVGRARSGNEDSYFCGRTVFAVADGLGGHQGGEVASAAAVEPLAALDGREFAD
ncbi:MAG: PP2C family protein-serine/threonine phosphatase, partial [Actinomycetota bacterium]